MDESEIIVCCESELLTACFSNALECFTGLRVAFIIPRGKWFIVCPLDVWWDPFALLITSEGGREDEDGLYLCKGT